MVSNLVGSCFYGDGDIIGSLMPGGQIGDNIKLFNVIKPLFETS